jgi:hypothetical protein
MDFRQAIQDRGPWFDRREVRLRGSINRSGVIMQCIIFIMGKQLQAFQSDVCPKSFFDGSGNQFLQYRDDDNGFYDWLRSPAGDIVGVRWFPYESFLLKNKRNAYLTSLDYVDFGKDHLEVAIYFSNLREIDESKSSDQDFCENCIYFSNNGLVAISFSLRNLSEAQRCLLPK